MLFRRVQCYHLTRQLSTVALLPFRPGKLSSFVNVDRSTKLGKRLKKSYNNSWLQPLNEHRADHVRGDQEHLPGAKNAYLWEIWLKWHKGHFHKGIEYKHWWEIALDSSLISMCDVQHDLHSKFLNEYKQINMIIAQKNSSCGLHLKK